MTSGSRRARDEYGLEGEDVLLPRKMKERKRRRGRERTRACERERARERGRERERR